MTFRNGGRCSLKQVHPLGLSKRVFLLESHLSEQRSWETGSGSVRGGDVAGWEGPTFRGFLENKIFDTVSPRSFTSSEGVFVIAPHDPALVASPSLALPASLPSAQAGSDCQGLAHLSPSPLPAHCIPPLLPSSPSSPEPRLTAAARLSCQSDRFLHSVTLHTLPACLLRARSAKQPCPLGTARSSG